MSEHTCFNCDAPSSLGAKTCVHCSQEIPVGEKIKCTNCLNMVRAGAKICCHCQHSPTWAKIAAPAGKMATLAVSGMIACHSIFNGISQPFIFATIIVLAIGACISASRFITANDERQKDVESVWFERRGKLAMFLIVRVAPVLVAAQIAIEAWKVYG